MPSTVRSVDVWLRRAFTTLRRCDILENVLEGSVHFVFPFDVRTTRVTCDARDSARTQPFV